MKTLLALATIALFSSNAQAAIKSAELTCEYKRELYTNNQLPSEKPFTIKGEILSDTDTDKYVSFKSEDMEVSGGYILRLEGGYDRSGLIPSDPDKVAWDPNGGSLYFDALLLKKVNAPGGKYQAVATGFAYSNLVSTPNELKKLKEEQATKSISASLSMENTEYHTLLANDVAIDDIPKDFLTRIIMSCQYSQK